MIAFAFFIALGAQSGLPADSVAVYSAILSQIRTEYPGKQVVLAETRSDVECMPVCGARLRDPDGTVEHRTAPPRTEHSARLLSILRERSLVDTTCSVPESTFGCAGLDDHVFVALGEITAAPRDGPEPVEGGVWVKAAFLLPCVCNCPSPGSDERYVPDAFGYWYLLRTAPDGTWTIIRRAPAFVV